MRPRWSLPLALASLGCAPAAPAPTPAAAPAAAPPAAPVSSGSWESVDPRAVRCGLDDRPRNVLGLRPLRSPLDAPRGQRGAKLMVIDPEPVPPTVVVKPQPLVIEDASASTLKAELSAIDPQYAVCSSLLADPRPPRPIELALELSPAGAPVRVSPRAPGETTAHTHCLMERVCQLQAKTAPGRPVTVLVPLRFSLGFQPGSNILPEGIVDGASEGVSGDGDALQRQLRDAAVDAARRCGYLEERARLRVTLVMQLRRSAPRTTPPLVSADKISMQAAEGSVPQEITSCMQDYFKARAYPAPPGFKPRTERILVTWTP